jgi:hypothetical protein
VTPPTKVGPKSHFTDSRPLDPARSRRLSCVELKYDALSQFWLPALTGYGRYKPGTVTVSKFEGVNSPASTVRKDVGINHVLRAWLDVEGAVALASLGLQPLTSRFDGTAGRWPLTNTRVPHPGASAASTGHGLIDLAGVVVWIPNQWTRVHQGWRKRSTHRRTI